MKTILKNGKVFGYEETKQLGKNTRKILVFSMERKEVETESKEIRSINKEEEKERERKNPDTGKMEIEKYFDRRMVNEEVKVITTSIQLVPIKLGEFTTYTMMFPHQLKESVNNFIESKSK